MSLRIASSRSPVQPLDVIVRAQRALGDDTRQRLLALMREGERTVSELADILAQSQPRISRHLKILAEAGLVERIPEGAWVYYGLTDREPWRRLADAALTALDPGDATLRRDRERLEEVRRRAREAADRFFAAHAADWDRIRSLHVPEAEVERAILAAAGTGPFRSVLDIGTGTGRMLHLLAGRAERLLGIDASQPMLAAARANLDRANIPHARVRPGDALNLALPRAGFDLVLLHQVLHYLDDPARAIAEAARVLAPAGRLLVVDFAPHALEFLRETQAHRRLGFPHEAVRQWLEAAGLAVESVADLSPRGDAADALTVTIWAARDRQGQIPFEQAAEKGTA